MACEPWVNRNDRSEVINYQRGIHFTRLPIYRPPLARVLSKFHEHPIGDCFEEASRIFAHNRFPRYNWLAAKGACVIVDFCHPLPVNFYVVHT